jgi:hypothetical protein
MGRLTRQRNPRLPSDRADATGDVIVAKPKPEYFFAAQREANDKLDAIGINIGLLR